MGFLLLISDDNPRSVSGIGQKSVCGRGSIAPK